MLILTKMLIAVILGIIISLILGYFIIPILKKINVNQQVSVHLNKRHILKNGTPTMGGLIFIIATLLIIVFLILLDKIKLNVNFALVLFVFISYALLGFIDDYIKIKKHNNEGLSIILKFAIQIVIALIFFFFFIYEGNSSVISFFFLKVDLKFLYGMFILFLLVASSNAVNITDGLDGLASILCIISYITYGIIALNSKYILGYEQIAIFSFVLAGALIGFLFFNFYPAKVFMGDLGSLSLGATLAAIAIILKNELSLAIIGIIYIIETLSSFIQIISIRYFKKRIFKKSPLHHHFEELGYEETDIIKIFFTFSLIVSLFSILIYVWL